MYVYTMVLEEEALVYNNKHILITQKYLYFFSALLLPWTRTQPHCHMIST